jgi:hypothetical protein
MSERAEHVWERRTIIISERGEQQLCLREEDNNHVCSQTWLLFSVSDIFVHLLSQIWLLFSSLRHDCCSPLSDMIPILREGNNNHVWERRTAIMSERGEQQSCLREENKNHVWERRTTMMSEREHKSDMIPILLSHTWLLFSLRHVCCSPLSDMIVVPLSQTWLLFENNNHFWERRTRNMSERGEQQSCLIEENNNHVWERRTTISQIWLLFSSLRHVLLSLTWLVLSSLRHDCCSSLSDMIVVLHNQFWGKRTAIMSERGKQQSCLREENNNHVRERRTDMFCFLGHNCCSPLSDMIIVLLSQT